MVKLIFLLKRKDGMSFEDFVEYYETRHQLIGCRVMPGCVKYQRRFLRYLGQTIAGAHPDDRYDVITELWFPDQATLDSAMAFAQRPDNAAIIAADEENFFDRSRIKAYVVDSERDSDLSVEA